MSFKVTERITVGVCRCIFCWPVRIEITQEARQAQEQPAQQSTGPRCQTCKSPLYLGLLVAECPRGCTDAMRKPTPQLVVTQIDEREAALQGLIPFKESSRTEMLWSVYGANSLVRRTVHPVREEAIRLWMKEYENS